MPDEPGRDRAGRIPRWVVVTGLVIGVVVALAVVVLVISGGEHGPGRHLSSDVGADPGGIIRVTAEPDGETR